MEKEEKAKKKLAETTKSLNVKEIDKFRKLEEKTAASSDTFHELAENLFAISQKTINYAFTYVNPVVSEVHTA